MHNKQSISSRLLGRLLQQASGGLLGSTALVFAMSGVALADSSPWYVAPQLGVIVPDDERGKFDNGTLAALSLGRELGTQWAVELRAATFAINGSVADRNTDQVSLGLDAHWYPFGRLMDEAILRPYLLAGIAFINTDIGDNFSSENAGTSIGLGASLRLFDTGVALRGESRYVTDFVDANDVNSFSDWQSTVGLKIPIGSQRETGASPVVEPAPATRKPIVARKTQAKPTAATRPSPKPQSASPPAPEAATESPSKLANRPFSPFSQAAPASTGAAIASRPIVSESASPPPEPEVVDTSPRKPAENAPAKSKPKTTEKFPARSPTKSEPATPAARRPAPSSNALLGSNTSDSDGDGIRNSVDLCAATPSGGYVDADGCPLQFGGKQTVAAAQKLATRPTAAPRPATSASRIAAKPAATPPKFPNPAKPVAGKSRAATTIPLKGVSFASGSDELTPGSGKAIARVAALMMKKPDLQVEIAGHADNQGGKAANLTLSERRAQAVKNALVAQGISFRRISTQGYGDTKPVASNETSAGKKENSRIELKLLRER